MRVKDLPESDRPRERLLRQGSRALSDREVLALVLGAGMPGCDAIEMAARLIDERGGLVALAQADPHTLSRLRGVGPARAARVTAAFELARRAAGVAERRRIRGSGISPSWPHRSCAASGTNGSSWSPATVTAVCYASSR